MRRFLEALAVPEPAATPLDCAGIPVAGCCCGAAVAVLSACGWASRAFESRGSLTMESSSSCYRAAAGSWYACGVGSVFISCGVGEAAEKSGLKDKYYNNRGASCLNQAGEKRAPERGWLSS